MSVNLGVKHKDSKDSTIAKSMKKIKGNIVAVDKKGRKKEIFWEVENVAGRR